METAPERYRRIRGAAVTELTTVERRQRSLIWIRTILFLAAGLFLVDGYAGGEPRWLLLTLGWTLAIGFLVAIAAHEHLRLRGMELHATDRLYRKLLARLDRRWNEFPVPALAGGSQDSELADDLDVFSEGSLYQLFSLAGTLPGRLAVESWLTSWVEWHEIYRRQNAVKALRDTPVLREKIVQSVASVSDGTEDVQALPEWAAGPLWLPAHRLPHVLSWLGPIAVATAVMLVALAMVSASPALMKAAGWTLASGFACNLLVTILWGSWLHAIFSRINGNYRDVFQFANVFETLADLPSDQGLLDEIRRTASEGPTSAVRAFRGLSLLMRLANLQRDVLLYFLYLALQLVVLWDFRVLELLERWQSRFGKSSQSWFDAIGTCEALICGATLAEEYPTWAFPVHVVGDEVIVGASGLGHPLLADSQRVTNDVSILRTQPLLLVTGSNMAGKSTLLRALGLNQILARTGSPVCATSMETQAFEVATSIRVRDSLREGVSFFMAELHRLKSVVDLAENNSTQEGRPVLFLLDEILQGTNSRERQIAVVTVIERLLKCHAAGIVSTHDLDLAALPAMQLASQIVHFREFFETIDGVEQMRFDYRMRPGPTPTTNALKLLKMVGLDAQ